MNKDKNCICLIGMPGSGKSTIGKLLSEKLKYSFFDTDQEIEKREKNKIKNIFSIKGEDYFRSVETQVFNELVEKKKIVISTGGGLILNNLEKLKLSFNIYLYCNIDVLIQRASRNNLRPLLSQNTPLQMTNLFNERKDIYIKIADVTINATDNQNVTITEIIKKIKNDN
ncbi:MAG: shikimate kinase [Alphaproteobacteria bacterium]|jgi:shikimate kinase